MAGYTFKDTKGTFTLKQPEKTGYLYFPIAGEQGLKSAITPTLGGDAKTDQNHFLFSPVSAEELHNNKSTRNFWCRVEGKGVWSATGASAQAAYERAAGCGEESELTAGLMWHQMKRASKEVGLSSEILSFVPVSDLNVEIMHVTIENTSGEELNVTAYGAIPMYARSADDIRDHRHVTSLLHRIRTNENSVLVRPTLSFDERGHQENKTTYYVSGVTGTGEAPEVFYPAVEDFVGEGGSYDTPAVVYEDLDGLKAGAALDGFEAIGAMRFAKVSLKPGEKATYVMLAGLDEDDDNCLKAVEAFGTTDKVMASYEETKEYWKERVNVVYQTGDKDFDNFMCWVSFQPMLRRIYGCSFLPHHDYGKGGRGWRDLWQDCLALLIMNPEGVKEMLLSNFGGVRMDGSNATIIGSKPGEFVADRNNICRVWMDHGVWPLMTTALYIDQTGDLAFLLKENTYFKDKQVCRGTKTDTLFKEGEKPLQKDAEDRNYSGSVLEHLLVQNLTCFYEVGEHNHMRLRGADWNDALDMAPERGESVAFTAAYAGNMETLANLIEQLHAEKKIQFVEVAEEMQTLFADDAAMYDDIEAKKALLAAYCETCMHTVSGRKAYLEVETVVNSLRNKAAWLKKHIRDTEWITDGEDGWFNSYYDNSGRAVEGIREDGVRMMLTGQVFTIMSGTAEDEQVAKIVNSADKYLYKKEVGGYRLNTDFKELKKDLGRMFGFAYGQKENGAVFSHMTTMYANALYKRVFSKEGYKALHTLYEQSADFETSRIYPGIPEYFNGRGRGMYHYLTGAASWYMLTVINEMFGVKGENGALCLEPKLMAEQFDEAGRAKLSLWFNRRQWNIIYVNQGHKEYGEYKAGDIYLDGKKISMQGNIAVSAEDMKVLDETAQHEIIMELI